MNTPSLRPSCLARGLAAFLGAAGCTPGTFEIPLPSTSDAGPTTTAPTTADSTTASTDPGDTEPTPSTGPDSSGDTTASCTPAEAFGDWWDEQWLRRRAVDIDTSIFPDSVSNFPVLVRLPAADLGATWSERGGADLRFRTADGGTALDYEIDDVDEDGQLFVWLKLPDLDPGAGSLSAWMYYEHPQADSWADAEDVWTGFTSVHHLGSDLEDSAGGHDGFTQWEPEICDGRCEPRIGQARTFVPERGDEVVLAGHQDYDLGNDPYLPSFNFTVTFWMRSSSLADYPWGPPVAKGDDTWRIHTTDLPGEDNERIAFAIDCYLPTCVGVVDAFGNYNLIGRDPADTVDDDVNDGAWHYVVTTFEDVAPPPTLPPEYLPTVQARLYIDGALVAQTPELDEILIYEDDQPVRFGHNINGGNRFGGELDEIRIMEGVRPAEAIAADYLTVVEPHTSVAEEQAICP